MGICISCHSTSVITGKLILPDGSLQEFSHPIKVADVLRKNPSTFICNSDEMDFDNFVSPIKDDDELQPGQLYFMLPLLRLKHTLQPEEMAALAVKASAALPKYSGRHCHKNVLFSEEKGRMRGSSKVADAYTIGLGQRNPGRGISGGGGKRQNFKVMLSSIPE